MRVIVTSKNPIVILLTKLQLPSTRLWGNAIWLSRTRIISLPCSRLSPMRCISRDLTTNCRRHRRGIARSTTKTVSADFEDFRGESSKHFTRMFLLVGIANIHMCLVFNIYTICDMIPFSAENNNIYWNIRMILFNNIAILCETSD